MASRDSKPRWARTALAVGVACTSAAACASLSGLSGGEDGGATGHADGPRGGAETSTHKGDGGVDSGKGHAPPVDARGDQARSLDVATSADSPGDQGSVQPHDAGGDALWCSVQPIPNWICADFDHVPTVSTGWTSSTGEHALETTEWVSFPTGGRFVLPAVDGGVTSESFLSTELWANIATPSSLTCKLEVYPTTLSSVSHDSVILFEAQWYAAGDGGITEVVELDVTEAVGDFLALVEYYPATNASVSHSSGSVLAASEWQSVHFGTSVGDGGSTRYSFTFGTNTISGTLAQPLPKTTTGYVSLGPSDFAGIGSTGWSFDFDNVLCY